MNAHLDPPSPFLPFTPPITCSFLTPTSSDGGDGKRPLLAKLSAQVVCKRK